MEGELNKNNASLQNSQKGFDGADKEADKFSKDVRNAGIEAGSASGKFDETGK